MKLIYEINEWVSKLYSQGYVEWVKFMWKLSMIRLENGIKINYSDYIVTLQKLCYCANSFSHNHACEQPMLLSCWH